MKKTNATSLSLLTFNTLGVPLLSPHTRKRTNQIAKEIEKSGVDIVCLQEVFSRPRVKQFRNLLKSYPYFAYKPGILGPKGGLVVFSKVPIVFNHFEKYPVPLDAHVPWYTKLSQNGILTVSLKHKPLTIKTTHLSSAREHSLDESHKFYKLISGQAMTVAKSVRDDAKAPNDVLLAGDFNIQTQTDLFNEMVKKAHVVDTSKGDRTPTYFHDRLYKIYHAHSSDRIDHIFASNKNKYTRVSHVKTMFDSKAPISAHKSSYLSDHIALKCDISFL